MLNGFRILFVNEFIAILRERVALFWIFFFPFFFLAIMLISYGTQGMFGRQRIEIIDLDHSALSTRYIEKVRSTFSSNSLLQGDIIVLDPPPSGNARSGALRVTIPAGFARAFTDSGSTVVTVAYAFNGGLASGASARVFTVLTAAFNSEAAAKPLPAQLKFENTTTVPPVGYLQYLLTGILVMSMMTAGMNNTCVGVVAQRERKTFKLMSCLPLTPWVYLAAILCARLVILIIAAFVLLFGSRYAFDVQLPLSPRQLLNAGGLMLVGGLTLLSMGMAMSARIARVQTAIVVCNVVYMSLLFASDLTMPLSSYPEAVKPFLSALPTSQFVAGLRAILIQGSDLFSEWRTVLSLCVWSAVCLLFSRAMFRWHTA
jgi:ABC-2 type transport system permease protein